MKNWTVYNVMIPRGDYVGVTSQPLNTRLIQLRSRYGIDGDIKAVAQFKTKDEAWAVENELRPEPFMGLNRARGGRTSSLPSPGAKNGMARHVRVHGVEYPTSIAAAKAHGVKETTALYRFNAATFSDWEFVS